jgi:uncharacterized protein (TIGR03790 family)
MKFFRHVLAGMLGLLAVGLLAAGGSVPDDLAARVVILANAREPASVALAEFYAEQRGVPRANLIALPLPEAESITWREFIDQVYQPLQDELYRRGWLQGTTTDLLDRFGRRRYAPTGSRISYLVVCRGVPLRIYNDPTLIEEKFAAKLRSIFRKNEAAVDAELSLLGMGDYEITAFLPNPLFNLQGPALPEADLVVKVSRLDGPTWESARHLVTAALEGERTGLLGRAYVDIGGPNKEGDAWLDAVDAQRRQAGFDGDTERTGATLGADARFDAPVLYFGWYAGNLNGPFALPGFAFPPGAVALHIHSFSAQTLRSETDGWCGPLVLRGVAATVGNVFEPYLGFTHRPDLLLRALLQGRNFGDAVYFSLPALSWEAVAIGDPLYRPFKVSLEKQELDLAGLPVALAPYATLRRANLLGLQGTKAEALALLQAGWRRQPGLVFGLAVARLALDQGDSPAAVAALAPLAQLKQLGPSEWPLARQAAGLLAAHEARPAALALYTVLANAKAPSPDALKALLGEARATADAAGNLALSLAFARQLNELTPPLPAPAPKPGDK